MSTSSRRAGIGLQPIDHDAGAWPVMTKAAASTADAPGNRLLG
jgi:hypothetical protein